MVDVREVKGKKDIKEFIEFPLRLYKGCEWFVPPLYADEMKLVMAGGIREVAESVFLLAERDGKVVGELKGDDLNQNKIMATIAGGESNDIQ